MAKITRTYRFEEDLIRRFDKICEEKGISKTFVLTEAMINFVNKYEEQEERKMKTWEREGYIVEEVEFDGDLHEFNVIKNGEVIATITPADIDDMKQIIEDLDNGEDVNGWEDGMGNTIAIE